ncbi:hypothetical protein HEP87_59650 [Streptomyces sp. S1D4-11]
MSGQGEESGFGFGEGAAADEAFGLGAGALDVAGLGPGVQGLARVLGVLSVLGILEEGEDLLKRADGRGTSSELLKAQTML